MAIIGIDFDGTLVTHVYPRVGYPLPGAIETLKALQAQGHKLILYTMRSDTTLTEAIDYCKNNGVEFWGINNNPDQSKWTNSIKVYCQLYIDDAALGCPLVYDAPSQRYAVNWKQVHALLVAMGLLLK